MRIPLLTGLLLLFPGFLQADCDQAFRIEPGGIVTATASGLTCARCLAGQSAPDCAGEAPAASRVDTLNRARASELAGITHWRMPQIEALFAAAPGCVADTFPGFCESVIWSASANIDHATDAWAFDAASGKRRVEGREPILGVLRVADPR